MKITNGTNGETTLTVSSKELGFLQATIENAAKECFTAALLNHTDVDAMAAELKDWLEYKRLDEKFRRRPEYEAHAAAVKSVFSKP